MVVAPAQLCRATTSRAKRGKGLGLYCGIVGWAGPIGARMTPRATVWGELRRSSLEEVGGV
jgi:hypothetical protein